MSSSINQTVQAGSRRSVDSSWRPRVNEVQRLVIADVLSDSPLESLSAAQFDELSLYVATGDAARLSSETRDELSAIAKTAKLDSRLSASQAKRVWPRKIASVALLDCPVE